MTDKMPEELYCIGNSKYYGGAEILSISKITEQPTETTRYIRADIHEAQLAERDRRIKELEGD